MDAAGTAHDIDALLAETIDLLTLRAGHADGTWAGDAPAWFGDVLFGGFVLAQAIVAATRGLPDALRLHSMHAYFLRPVVAAKEIEYDVRTVREGRAFTTRRVDASQDGKPTLALSCSFTTDTDGYVYDLPGARAVPARDGLTIGAGPGPWQAAFAGPTPARSDGTRDSTHRVWFRIPSPLPDDQHLHAALLGFATDWTGVGGRPLDLDGDMQGMVSIDHAAWFHRPARADDWLFYDVESLVNAGGRGLLRGVIRDADGHVVVSVAQEMRIAVVAGDQP